MAILLCAPASEALAARIALVIGNGRYVRIDALRNPVLDARSVASELAAKGFDVTRVENVDLAALRGSISAFLKSAQSLEKGSIALVYYAGHGVQVSGANYLLPVDANADSAAVLLESAYPLSDLVGRIPKSTNRTFIVVLDACRDAPSALARVTVNPGFTRVAPPAGAMVSFSTAEGAPAADGIPGAGSPFARAFATEMRQPDQAAETFFRNVRIRVLRATENAQSPTEFVATVVPVSLTADIITPEQRTIGTAFGRLGRGDRSGAFRLMRQAAESGGVAAMTHLSYFYREGIGNVVDQQAAMRWLDRAAERGDEAAMLQAAGYSLVIPTRWQAAMRTLETFEKRGSEVAAYYLASEYYAGAPEFRNHKEARRLAEMAAKNGYAPAMPKLGIMLMRGHGGPVDPDRGEYWLRRSVESGSPEGMGVLGAFLSTAGTGVHPPGRDEKAVALLRKAVARREFSAGVTLALHAFLGLGMARDEALAKALLQSAIAEPSTVEGTRQYARALTAMQAEGPLIECGSARAPRVCPRRSPG